MTDRVRQSASWMQLPIDERILEVLESSGLILSPAVIALNIDKSRGEVNRRLSTLADYGLITRVKRGYYEITSDGQQYLAGELDAAGLAPNETDGDGNKTADSHRENETPD